MNDFFRKFLIFSILGSGLFGADVHSFTTPIHSSISSRSLLKDDTDNNSLRVSVDIDLLLSRKINNKKDKILIHLNKNESISIKLTKIKHHLNSSNFSWFGEDKTTNSSVILSIRDRKLVGQLSAGEDRYKIMPRDNDYIIFKFDQNAMVPLQNDSIQLGLQHPLFKGSVKNSELNYLENLTRAVSEETTTINVLLLYTWKFAQEYGVSAKANIQNIFDYALNAHENSHTGVVLNLVGTVMLPKNSKFNDIMPQATYLDDLAQDGYIQHLRRQYKADMVSLINHFYTPVSCGIAYTPSSFNYFEKAYSIVMYGRYIYGSGYYFCDDKTLAHELGHNFGCHHDISHDTGNAIYSYAYGYDKPGTFATIMSYDSPSIAFFSNPNIRHSSSNLLIGDANTADNARTIRENRFELAKNKLKIDESLESGDNINGNQIEGVLSTRYDKDAYTVKLGGITKILGTNIGYNSWYFYIDLYNTENHEKVYSTERDDTVTLPNGEYKMVVYKGIWSGSNSYYKISFDTHYEGNDTNTTHNNHGTLAPILLYLLN